MPGDLLKKQNFIPRFVIDSTYADSFGHLWNAFEKSQLDTIEFKESSIRFDTELGWNESDLMGKTVFEIGSGAGRFIDIVSKRNAKLAFGIDITDAVDASHDNLGDREKVFLYKPMFLNCHLKKTTSILVTPLVFYIIPQTLKRRSSI